MSWEIALIVSSVVSAGAQVAKGISEADATILKANIEKGQALENADLAKLSAVTDEIRTRKAFDIWENAELANSFYEGPSWLAKRDFAEEEMDRDVGMLQVKGRLQSDRWITTARAKGIEAKSAQQSKWFSVVSAGGEVFKGAYMADHYSPSKGGNLMKMWDNWNITV
jgi:hypothetical protein